METDRKIAIIGGGIGGLTTAIALRQKGFEPVVYEAAPELRPMGAGIVLAINAMRVFARLGLAEQALAYGHPLHRMEIVDEQFRTINRTALAPLIEEYGLPNLGIHRGRLQQLLLENLPEDAVRLGKRLQKLREGEKGLALKFEDGTEARADILIGADGIHSQVRRQLFPGYRERGAGQACWRGICRQDISRWQQRGTEAWAPGRRFGVVPIGEGELYWFAVVKEKKHKDWASMPRAAWKRSFDVFPFAVQELIADTPEEQIIYSPIADLEPLDSWHAGPVVLLGDAAHATTPNMGQGACQAIEDALALAQALADHPYPEAFQHFQQERKPKADWVVRQSRTLGWVAQWESAWLARLRNTLLARVPERVALAGLRRLVGEEW